MPHDHPSAAAPRRRRGRALRRLLLGLTLAVLLAGCREEAPVTPGAAVVAPEPAGAPRAFLLGFSSAPAALTDEAYAAAFDRAATYGEIVLLQRSPAWREFRPGGALSREHRDAVAAELRALEARDLRPFPALDPFDPAARERLASAPGDPEATLDDPDLRRAFVAEATFLALNYHPPYLALGVEVNSTFEVAPRQFEAFLGAYAEAYDAVKAVSPETLVFPTFQYEQLLGIVPWEPPHAPRWELLERFGARIDAFAITTYPSYAYAVARKVPPLYYQQIVERTDLPIVIASAGYASAPGRDGINASTPTEQRRYLARLLTDVEAMGVPLLVWFAGADPAYATEPPYDLLFSIGLRTADDEPKEAWATWEEAARRPYDPAAAPATPTPDVTPNNTAPDGDQGAADGPANGPANGPADEESGSNAQP